MKQRGRHRRRRLVALATAAALGLPLAATARGAPPTATGITAGPVTALAVQGDTVEITTPAQQVRVVFLTDDLFRIWTAGPDGVFRDPANTPPKQEGAPAADIVVKRDYPGVTPGVVDAGPYYKLSTRSIVLRVDKARLRFALHRLDGSLIWEELSGTV